MASSSEITQHSGDRTLPTCCNPVINPDPVIIDHVLLALRESKEERESRFRGLFNFFDTLNTSYLDLVQIEIGLSAMKIPNDYKFVKELVRVCDANKDGRVDYDEFRMYMDHREIQLYKLFRD